MANLITIGTTTSAWFDVTVAAGSPKTLFIIDTGAGVPIASGPKYELAHKTSGSAYNVIAELNTNNILQFGGLAFPGVYGVRRIANGYSSGMDVEG